MGELGSDRIDRRIEGLLIEIRDLLKGDDERAVSESDASELVKT